MDQSLKGWNMPTFSGIDPPNPGRRTGFQGSVPERMEHYHISGIDPPNPGSKTGFQGSISERMEHAHIFRD